MSRFKGRKEEIRISRKALLKMLGSGKDLTEWEYLAASNAMREDNYIPIGSWDDVENGGKFSDPESPMLDPEKEIIKADLLDHLSIDAKFVLHIIDDSPKEALTPSLGKVTLKSVTKYLMHRYHWQKRKVNSRWNEVKECMWDIINI